MKHFIGYAFFGFLYTVGFFILFAAVVSGAAFVFSFDFEGNWQALINNPIFWVVALVVWVGLTLYQSVLKRPLDW